MTQHGEVTKVTFYELTQSDEQDEGHLFLCRLIEKAWSLGHYILVLSPDEAVLQALDDKLWQFSQESFLPHGRFGEVNYSP
ncbi:MAG TPA: DNA polymerase III subunit chi, partial [Pseudomonadales bacterium]|nr:DNA polymerase III subunit chi [Pseudomonadales bacterium]